MSMTQPLKPPPRYLFALGGAELPPQVVAEGVEYHFVRLFKHDFFAATGLYETAPVEGQAPRQAVLKVQRTYPLPGLPVRWLGRRVARHEIGIYRKLQGVAGVPRLLGEVGSTGFLHEFIPGCELHPELPLTPEFFEQLRQLLLALHAQGVAYVDTNKRENILYGTDDRPWLIDFQISFVCPKYPRGNPLARWLLARLQAEDWYHFYKHKTRLIPEACGPEEFARATRQSLFIRLHRFLAQPLIRLRRRFLARYELQKVK